MNKLSISVCTLLCGAAHAQQCTTLLYVGAPFTAVVASDGNAQPVSSPLTGTVTLEDPLPFAGVTNVTPVNWDFSGQYAALNFTDDTFPPSAFVNDPPTFQFTTVNGVITSWNMQIAFSQATGQGSQVAVSSTPSGDSVYIRFFDTNQGPPGDNTTITGTSSAPGTWVCQVSYVSSFAAAPPAATPAVVPTPTPPVVTPAPAVVPESPLARQLRLFRARVFGER